VSEKKPDKKADKEYRKALANAVASIFNYLKQQKAVGAAVVMGTALAGGGYATKQISENKTDINKILIVQGTMIAKQGAMLAKLDAIKDGVDEAKDGIKANSDRMWKYILNEKRGVSKSGKSVRSERPKFKTQSRRAGPG